MQEEGGVSAAFFFSACFVWPCSAARATCLQALCCAGARRFRRFPLALLLKVQHQPRRSGDGVVARAPRDSARTEARGPPVKPFRTAAAALQALTPWTEVRYRSKGKWTPLCPCCTCRRRYTLPTTRHVTHPLTRRRANTTHPLTHSLARSASMRTHETQARTHSLTANVVLAGELRVCVWSSLVHSLTLTLRRVM